MTDRLRFAAILNRWCVTPWLALMKPRDRTLIPQYRSINQDYFFGGIGPCGPVPPPPLEWNSILPLVTAVLIMPKSVEPPGSRRIGAIGAQVLILPSETVY